MIGYYENDYEMAIDIVTLLLLTSKNIQPIKGSHEASKLKDDGKKVEEVQHIKRLHG